LRGPRSKPEQSSAGLPTEIGTRATIHTPYYRFSIHLNDKVPEFFSVQHRPVVSATKGETTTSCLVSTNKSDPQWSLAIKP